MIVGAAKSGTTTLYRVLADHPEVFFPPSEKEPFYFCFGGKEPELLNSITRDRVKWKTEDYLDLYKSVSANKLCGDASTAYLYKHEEVVANMKALYGERYKEVKIIMILRNPVDRAYSHYTFLVRNGYEDLSFEEALKPEKIAARKEERWGFDYLDYGAYPTQVNTFLNEFPACQVLLMNELKEKQTLIDKVTAFLGVSSIEVGPEFTANPSGVPKNRFLVNQLRKNGVLKWMVNLMPEGVKHKLLNKRDAMMSKLLVKEPMSPEIRSRLIEHYRSDIQELEQIIGKDLKHWMN